MGSPGPNSRGWRELASPRRWPAANGRPHAPGGDGPVAIGGYRPEGRARGTGGGWRGTSAGHRYGLPRHGVAPCGSSPGLRTRPSLAGVALALGQPERAVRVLSAVEALRATSGLGRMPHAAHIARILAEVRTSLPEPAFATTWEEGRHLSVAEAVAEAGAIVASTLEPAQPLPGEATSFGLTARELDVLRLLVEGHSDRQIGEALFIGARTVQTHVANLFAKLGVNARAEAAAVAVRRGLV